MIVKRAGVILRKGRFVLDPENTFVRVRTFVVRSFVRAVGFLQHDRTCFLGFFEKINLLIRRDLLEVKLNLKIIISKDSFNALFVVKFPVIRKI